MLARLRLAVLAPLLALVAGCAPPPPLDELSGDDLFPVSAELRARSGRVYAANKTVLFVNFDGATISKASNMSDAETGQSFIGGGTIPPFAGDAAARAGVIGYLKALYAAYDLTIVTARPASGDYDMAVVGGWPASIGLGAGPAGVAPLDCGNVLRRDISFTFSEVIRSSLGSSASSTLFLQHVAKTIAHETGHTYGLPHSADGCDLMSYSQCAQPKAFLDKEMALQADSQGPKGCNLGSMNSHKLLLQALGPAPAPPAPPADVKPPVVSIESPAPAAAVASPFALTASLVDDHGVVKAELREGTALLGSRTGAPYTFQVALSEGPHTLTVVGYDAAGNAGSATLSITITTAPPSIPGPDAGGPSSDLGPAPAASGSFGAPCAGPDECTSGLCVRAGAAGFCTRSCEAGESCPSGSRCRAASGGVHVCGPVAATEAPQGCSVSGGTRSTPLSLALLLLLAHARRRRRTRPRSAGSSSTRSGLSGGDAVGSAARAVGPPPGPGLSRDGRGA